MNNTICKFCDGRGYYELTARVECGHCRGTGITPPMTQDNMKRVTVEGINRTTHHVEDNKEQLREEQKRREEAAELLASYIKQKGANYLANHEIVSMMVEFRKASAFDKKEVARAAVIETVKIIKKHMTIGDFNADAADEEIDQYLQTI